MDTISVGYFLFKFYQLNPFYEQYFVRTRVKTPEHNPTLQSRNIYRLPLNTNPIHSKPEPYISSFKCHTLALLRMAG